MQSKSYHEGVLDVFLEKRHQEILKLLEKKQSVTLHELMEVFHASESTIRRDLTALHDQGKLFKVFGGAVTLEEKFNTRDEKVSQREEKNRKEKIKIARYAAAMIKKDDFVFIDAGTTTGHMIDFVEERAVTYVTNGITHARRLAERGFKTIIIGGELKESTEAVVGNEAMKNLEKYNFTLGFFGANGISRKLGYMTPDVGEALVKQKAMEKSCRRYVLCDACKFGDVSSVTFGEFMDAVILTDYIPKDAFENCSNIISIR